MDKVLMFGVMVLLRGLAVMLLWNWYVVPFGIMAIGIFHGFGIGLLGSVLSYDAITAGHIAAAEDDIKKSGDLVRIKNIAFTRRGISLLQPIVMIAVGFLFSFFV